MKKGKLIAIAGMVLVMGSAFPVSAAESLADFDYQTYADTYPDLKAAFETTASEKLDPLPPLNPGKMPDWFDARTPVESMTNARLVAEYNALVPYMEEHDLSFEGPLSRKEELLSEMNIRLTRYDYYEDYKDAFGEAAAAGIKNDPAYQRAAASDITPLREFMG